MSNYIKKNNWKNYFHHVPGIKRKPDELGEDRAYAENGKVNVIAIADGVSGAGYLSAAGAHLITKIIVPFLSREFENIWEIPPEKLFPFLAKNLGGIFWKRLNEFCKEYGEPTILENGFINENIDKYRTTVVACAVYDNRMIFVKFGNGFAVICSEHGAELISASKTDGYATPDITLLCDPNNSEFEIGRYFLTDNVRSIALFSDGADYNKELYDLRTHKIGGGYVSWIEQAVKSEEDFKDAVTRLAKDNSIKQDDVSVAIMLDETVPCIDKIVEKSSLQELYMRITSPKCQIYKPIGSNNSETEVENQLGASVISDDVAEMGLENQKEEPTVLNDNQTKVKNSAEELRVLHPEMLKNKHSGYGVYSYKFSRIRNLYQPIEQQVYITPKLNIKEEAKPQTIEKSELTANNSDDTEITEN